MDCADVGVVSVVFWAVRWVGGRVDEGVHAEAGAEGVEREDVEDGVLVHEGLRVGVVPGVVDEVARGAVEEEADDAFVDEDKASGQQYVFGEMFPEQDF